MARRQPPIVLGNLRCAWAKRGFSESRSIAAVTAASGEPGRFPRNPRRSNQAVNVIDRRASDLWMEIRRLLPIPCAHLALMTRSGIMTCAPSHATAIFIPALPQAGRSGWLACGPAVRYVCRCHGRNYAKTAFAHGRPSSGCSSRSATTWAVPRGCSSGEASALLFNLGASGSATVWR